MNDKPWYASRTIWVNVLALFASVGTMAGVDLGLDEAGQGAIVAGVMAVVNVVLRLRTNRGIAKGAALVAACALPLALAACAGTAETRAVGALAIACDAYATALDQLTPRKAGLSAALVVRVDRANALVAPACGADSAVDPAAAVAVVRAGLDLLNAVRTGN